MTDPAHLPYSGIATFARAPVVSPDGDWRATFAVLGIPFDIALGFRPGARFAPRALREASLRCVPPFLLIWTQSPLRPTTACSIHGAIWSAVPP